VLLVDGPALDRNITRTAAFATAAGLKLRPHSKTHKSPEIARRQLAAGAVGQCCAKLGKAEALAEGGMHRRPADHLAGWRRSPPWPGWRR
jgi:D-serine deaminase-like pyridoxal phosphate-dependent protein